MKIIDLDDNIIEWNPTRHITAKVKNKNKSKLHLAAVDILHSLFPTCQLLEEVELPIQKNLKLFVDIYIPLLKIAIEVQGVQHYKRIPFFQKTKLAYYHQLKLDRDKQYWCDTNNITLILLPYDQQNNWKQIILDKLSSNARVVE